MIWKTWKVKSLEQEKDVLTDLMKDTSGNLLGSTVYFGKSRADGSKETSI